MTSSLEQPAVFSYNLNTRKDSVPGHDCIFDNCNFQVYMERGKSTYFMFGEEYSFSEESLQEFLQFLYGMGMLEMKTNYASRQEVNEAE